MGGIGDLALKRTKHQRILGDGSFFDLLAGFDAQIGALW